VGDARSSGVLARSRLSRWRWGAATIATANCGLRRCTERDLSIVRPTFSGDVGDPYVRPRARHILRPRKRGSTGLQDSGSSVGQRKPAS
jgi:hypothetical protein